MIEIHSCSLRSTRGYASPVVVADEIAFWRSEESANPDSEVINALRPGMSTIPGSLLLAISSPYSRRGELWANHKRHFGQDDSDILVWQAASLDMNPILPKRVVERAFARDSASAAAEYGAEFRSDIEGLVSHEVVEAAVVPGRYELPYCEQFQYVGFCDPSGGSSDSMTLAVAHREEENRVVLDAIREVRPPFSPEQVTKEFAELLKAYRIHTVTGDRYGAEWVSQSFERHGIRYETAEKPKSDLYRELLPLLNSGQVELLDNDKLKAQLLNLERRTARGGRDSIDHPPGAHDDIANAVAGVLVACGAPQPSWGFISLSEEEPDDGFRPGSRFTPLGAGPPRRQVWKPWDGGSWRQR
jgi:hypothetical protein